MEDNKMARTRSPNYPALGLPDAIKRAAKLWEIEKRSPMDEEAAAKDLGYNGLNGASLPVISALKKYGLLEPKGAGVALSSDAITILVDHEESADRKRAIHSVAMKPALFSQLAKAFPEGPPGKENLKIYLIKKGFVEDAAKKASEAYLSTMALVSDGGGNHTTDLDEVNEPGGQMEQVRRAVGARTPLDPPPVFQIKTQGAFVVFPLPRNNQIEIRLRSKVSEEEFQQLQKMLDLLKSSLVQEEEDA